jgi:hypothetical protein
MNDFKSQIAYLLTAIANRSMLIAAPRLATGQNQILQTERAVMKKQEVVSWVMTVSVLQETCHTKIVVLAFCTGDHLSLIELCL